MTNTRLAELVALRKAERLAHDAMMAKAQNRAQRFKGRCFKVKAGAAANARARAASDPED